MVFKKKNISEESDETQIRNLQIQQEYLEDQAEDDQFTQPEASPSLDEPQVSDKIITPQSAFVSKDQLKYMKEVFTRDLTTAFCNDYDRSIVDQLANLLAHTDFLREKYFLQQRRSNWDLASFHNMTVNNVHKIANTSKMVGKAAKVAKSMYTESSGYLHKEISKPKKKGLF